MLHALCNIITYYQVTLRELSIPVKHLYTHNLSNFSSANVKLTREDEIIRVTRITE